MSLLSAPSFRWFSKWICLSCRDVCSNSAQAERIPFQTRFELLSGFLFHLSCVMKKLIDFKWEDFPCWDPGCQKPSQNLQDSVVTPQVLIQLQRHRGWKKTPNNWQRELSYQGYSARLRHCFLHTHTKMAPRWGSVLPHTVNSADMSEVG